MVLGDVVSHIRFHVDLALHRPADRGETQSAESESEERTTPRPPAGLRLPEEISIMKKPATPASVFVVSLITTVVQFGLAIVAFGGWAAFFSHPTLTALTLVTLGLIFVAPFTSGNLNSGEKEDRGNRWVLIAFSLIALASAVVPAYTDRIGLWTIDGDATRWVGVTLYALGGALRLWPVFVLGFRFSGLVAIQPGHALETHGVYSTIRNPGYLGMLILMLGWGLAFRGWSGVVIALLLLVPLNARMRAEERLLRAHFGAEYDAYVAPTWRLIPRVY
jgi:protein-S-isoprenylcysteine O-methyltransferase Ste14